MAPIRIACAVLRLSTIIANHISLQPLLLVLSNDTVQELKAALHSSGCPVNGNNVCVAESSSAYSLRILIKLVYLDHHPALADKSTTISDLDSTMTSRILSYVFVPGRPPPLRLCLVSKDWKRLMEEPDMWTDVYFNDEFQNGTQTLKEYLKRSRTELIDVTIQFHKPSLPSKSAELKAASMAAVALCQEIGEILMRSENSQRIYSLDFVGYPAKVFPLDAVLVNLRRLKITFLANHTGRAAKISKLFKHEVTHLQSLTMHSEVSKQQFADIKTTSMRSIKLFYTPHPLTLSDGFQSLGQFQQLTHLRLKFPPELVDPTEVTRKLDLPVLLVLNIDGRPDTFGRVFSRLPQLEHLTIIGGRVLEVKNKDKKPLLESVNFGGPCDLASAWPLMENLVTLTVDHADMTDLIPTLGICSRLKALHLHGNWGFTTLVGYLYGLTLPGAHGPIRFRCHQDIYELDPDDSSPGPNPLPVPGLRLLRLWPVHSDCERSGKELESQKESLLCLVRKLLDSRPQLEIELASLRSSLTRVARTGPRVTDRDEDKGEKDDVGVRKDNDEKAESQTPIPVVPKSPHWRGLWDPDELQEAWAAQVMSACNRTGISPPSLLRFSLVLRHRADQGQIITRALRGYPVLSALFSRDSENDGAI